MINKERYEIGFDCWPWQYWSLNNPTGIALVYGECSFTWRDVSLLVDGYARQLHEQGLRQEQLVAAISVNSPDVLWLYLACLRLGACCAILDPKQGREQLNDKLETLNARFIWIPEAKLNTLDILQNNSSIQLYFSHASFNPVAALLNTSFKEDESCFAEWQGQRLASLAFTSGSTGRAKAVAHCADNHLHSAAGLLSIFSYATEDNWLLSLPLFHVSGVAIVWRWLFAGGKITLALGEGLVELLSKVTHASLVPTQLRRYLDELTLEHHSSTLKRVLLGGAIIPVELTNKAKELGIDCWTGYGMTEMASTVTAKQADSSSGVGALLQHRELAIEDKIIKVRGKCLGMGYYDHGVIKPMVDSEGWLIPEDLGIEAKGDCLEQELFILGRADNMFISGGENIHPEQIERALLSHPLINQALVFPIHDLEFGQRPIAVIDSIEQLSLNQMNKYLKNKLIKFMWPIKYYPLPDAISVTGIKLNRASVQLWVTSLSE